MRSANWSPPALSAEPILVAGNAPAFGAYVHWPFCRKKCPYCDFNSHVAPVVDHDAWRRAFAAEIAADARRFGTDRPPLASVFFGGGTPSLMEAETVAAVLAALDRHFGLAGDAEITLEANPTSVEAGRLAAFLAAGINRVSLGVQSLDDDVLAFLGREHSAAEALRAVDTAASVFDRFSLDLIYARPGQTPAAWHAELTRALDHAGGHLSAYQLTIEPGTQFETRHARGDFHLPPDDLSADLYELTQEMLEQAAMPAYEVSNHAAAGAECRHNLIYWTGGDWLAFGPGAHGRMTTGAGRVAYRRHRAPAVWLRQALSGADRPHADQVLSARETAEEYLMMGLRTRSGISLDRLSQAAMAPWDRVIDGGRLRHLEEEGVVRRTGDRIAVTRRGMLTLDGVLGYLLADGEPVS